MRARTPAVLALLAILALALVPTAASAAPPTLNELEGEVMCPICGTLLELVESPQAEREKVFISKLISEGRSKEQIKDALVAEYGAEVLAKPEGSGFNLSAYLVPIIAFLLAAVALVIGVWRWRRAGRDAEAGPAPGAPALSAADAERLDTDLGKYDL